jgi:hypothetical protein
LTLLQMQGMIGFVWARVFVRAREDVKAFEGIQLRITARSGALVALSEWGAKGKVQKGTAFVGAGNKAILRETNVMICAVHARFLERQSASCQRRQQKIEIVPGLLLGEDAAPGIRGVSKR